MFHQFTANHNLLVVHVVVADGVGGDRLEGARAHVQRHIFSFNSFIFNILQ